MSPHDGPTGRLHDTVTHEVVRSMLVAAANETWSAVTRSAYSPLWKEAGDMACGVLDADCQLVAAGEGNTPTQLGTFPMSAAEAVGVVGDELVPGDLVVANDPFAGGNHLPDVLFLMPAFAQGELLGFVGVRGHLPDIGGASPGSMGQSTEVFAEGLVIPPVRLVRAGEPDGHTWRMLLANLRHPLVVEGDIQSAWGACRVGTRRLAELGNDYGIQPVRDAMASILRTGRSRMQRIIGAVPDGVYQFSDTLDDDGTRPRPVRIRVTVTVNGERMSVDFAGSDTQAPGNVNAPYAVTCSATYYAVKAVLDPWSSVDSGTFSAVDVTAPAGSVVNATHPAAVANGNTETAARIADTVLGALAAALPGYVPAAGGGTSMVLFVSGQHGDGRYTIVEVQGGAQGAGQAADGRSAVRVGPGNTGNTSSEVLENAYPVEVLRYSLAEDSGGPGRHRGGLGVHRRVRVLEDATLIASGDRAVHSSYGLEGGQPGGQARVVVTTPGEQPQTFESAKVGPMEVVRGTIIDVIAPGGGGYGNPLDRDSTQLEQDMDDGIVTATGAARYGR